MRKTVGGVALSFVLAVVLGISGAIAPGGGAALGASTTLTILSGEVQVSRNGGAFEPAADGAIIGPGDVIRTAADSRAVLTYFEGSTVSVEPSSELAIDEASSNPDGSTVVVMSQNLGRTWHVVTKLITGGSKYEVRTPAATASVRGTAFELNVTPGAAGQSVTHIRTAEGAVAASAPATVADPQPAPVIIAAGFQATASIGDRTLQAPTLAPEPERKVTVTVGSANALVVDPLGRSNGFKDGKLVLQTPGAQVVRTAGTLLITLPDIPDGKLSTVVTRSADAGSSNTEVPVITTVQERGKSPTLVQDSVQPTETVTGVEMKRSGSGPEATPDVRRVTEDEKKDLNTGKTVVEPPKIEPTKTRPGLGGDPSVLAKIVEETRARSTEGTSTESKAAQPGDGESASKQKATVPSAGTSSVESGSGAPRGPGFVQQLPFQGAPSIANQQREDAKREDDRNDLEREIKKTEQLQEAAQGAIEGVVAAQKQVGQEQQNALIERQRAEEVLRQEERRRLNAQREKEEADQKIALAKDEQVRAAARQESDRKALELKEAQERTEKAKRDALKAEQERLEREAKQRTLEAAQRAAQELKDKLQRQLEEQREQQQKQQSSGTSGNRGSGKSEEIIPPGGAVNPSELLRPPGSGRP